MGSLIIGTAMVAYLVTAPDCISAIRKLQHRRGNRHSLGSSWLVLAGAGLAFSLLIGHPRGPGRLFPNLTWPSLALQFVGLDLAVVGGVIVGAAR